MDASGLMIVLIPKLWIVRVCRRVYMIDALRYDRASVVQVKLAELIAWLRKKPPTIF
jgi:hypothetical protein